jgi:vacuolar-type H+-ATPase subunit D/Vma8
LPDQKLRILHDERRKLELVVQRTERTWAAASEDAQVWLLRGTLLGGERAVRLAATPATADLTITWCQLMGVRYPTAASWSALDTDPSAPPPTAAIAVAREAHRRALEAAVKHAVALAACRELKAEEQKTRRRRKAIDDRLIPRLLAELASLDLRLEEQEHGDAVRARWARDTLDTRQS